MYWHKEKIMERGLALLAGLVFGIGLIIAGMVDPAKVLGFLDLGGCLGSIAGLGDGWRNCGGYSDLLVGQRPLYQRLWQYDANPDPKRDYPTLDRGQFDVWRGLGLGGGCAPALRWSQRRLAIYRLLCLWAAMLTGFALFQVLETRRS
jgi:hypothetical protein